MNRLLASTSVVVLALMTMPGMAQTGSDATMQHAPAPTQVTAPTALSPASPPADPAKAPASTAQATTPAAPGTLPGATVAPAATPRAPAPAVMPSAPAAVVTPPAAAPSVASPATAPSATQRASETDTARLVGRTVRNAAEESIGEITSVVIARDGSVSSVIVGVGGFLGVGQREVAIRWQDLQIRENGAVVHTNVTREQLAALPAYQYAPNQRPGVIAFPATLNAPALNAPMAAAPATPATPATAAPVAAAALAAGGMSANDIIGSSVRSPANEAIGRVYDILLDRTGAARSLVVSSGGMLGIGDRRVELPYSEVRLVREGSTLSIVSRLTAAQIAQVAEYVPTAR